MARTITEDELRRRTANVIDAIVQGDCFVVTRRDRPVAELRPVRPRRLIFVPAAKIVALAATGPHIDRGRFERDRARAIDTTP
jgi:antitoxin (DNA-binding transcriptional repressor) of toxin-antitoxin stability system